MFAYLFAKTSYLNITSRLKVHFRKKGYVYFLGLGSLVAIRITQKSYFFSCCLVLVRKYCKLALCCSNRPPGLGNQGCLFYPCLIPEVLDWSSAAISLCQKLANCVQKIFFKNSLMCLEGIVSANLFMVTTIVSKLPFMY